MDWHDRVMFDGLEITSLPAIHMSKRGLFDRNRTLWTSYGLRTAERSLYVAGDTAYGPVFKQMRSTLDDFDLGLVPIGAYDPRLLMRGVHTTRLVAKHWGTIQLTDEPLFEPPGRFRTAARVLGYAEDDIWVMKIGETRAI